MTAHPNTMYRLTAKAVIANDRGEVLLLREAGGSWGLPGGGVEHNEPILQALTRELQEEIGITNIGHIQLIGAMPFYSHGQQDWWLWLLYKVKATLPKTFAGELSQQVEFIDIATFKDSTKRDERLLYEALIRQLTLKPQRKD